MDLSWQPRSGAAQRPRKERLRAAWQHEQQSVAKALAAFTHHSALRGRKKARAGEEESEVYYTAEVDEEDAEGGVRPGVLAEPRPQARVQRHTLEHIADFVRFAPMVQILDAPVPQMGDQLPDIMRFFDTLTPDAEQVIEVPKILPDDVPVRTAVRDTQLGEQLVGSAEGAGVRTCGGCLEGLLEAGDPWVSLKTGFNSVWVRAL